MDLVSPRSALEFTPNDAIDTGTLVCVSFRQPSSFSPTARSRHKGRTLSFSDDTR